MIFWPLLLLGMIVGGLVFTAFRIMEADRAFDAAMGADTTWAVPSDWATQTFVATAGGSGYFPSQSMGGGGGSLAGSYAVYDPNTQVWTLSTNVAGGGLGHHATITGLGGSGGASGLSAAGNMTGAAQVQMRFGHQVVRPQSVVTAMQLQAAIAATQLETPAGPPLDPDQPNTMGWRWWYWNPAEQRLMSPHTGAIWHDAELHCEEWCEEDVVRGVSGIHARFVPLDWTQAVSDEVPKAAGWIPLTDHVISAVDVPKITGLVERFGKYVLGTEGFRCEWAIIRKLYARATDIGLALERAYPEVEIIYPKET